MPCTQGRFKNRVTTLIHTNLTIDALRSTNILLRDDGRTRRRLPIACAAPRPCSTTTTVPLHTDRGSLNVFRGVLFSSLPYLINLMGLLYYSKAISSTVNIKYFIDKNFNIFVQVVTDAVKVL